MAPRIPPEVANTQVHMMVTGQTELSATTSSPGSALWSRGPRGVVALGHKPACAEAKDVVSITGQPQRKAAFMISLFSSSRLSPVTRVWKIKSNYIHVLSVLSYKFSLSGL